jgi:phage terminase large subunit-like protein
MRSRNRLDWLVWALAELMLGGGEDPVPGWLRIIDRFGAPF